MDAFLPIFTLLALYWTITKHRRRRATQQRAGDLQHHLARVHAKEAICQGLRQGTGWGQIPDIPTSTMHTAGAI